MKDPRAGTEGPSQPQGPALHGKAAPGPGWPGIE